MSEKLEKSITEAFERFAFEILAFGNALVFLRQTKNLCVQSSELKAIYDGFEKKTKPQDVETYFLNSLFSNLISSMELFFQDTLKGVIAEHPKKIGTTQFKLSVLLDLNTRDELLSLATDAFLNSILYKKPLEYLDELVKILSIDKSPFEQHWLIFIEAKARRDLGIHNGWKCNQTYIRKVSEAGITSSLELGQIAHPDTDYSFRVMEALTEISGSILRQLAVKYDSSENKSKN